jgi:hypothetical protein
MSADLRQDFGRRLCRRRGIWLVSPNSPPPTISKQYWAILEVYERGLSVQPDTRVFTQLRRWLNIVAMLLLQPWRLLPSVTYLADYRGRKVAAPVSKDARVLIHKGRDCLVEVPHNAVWFRFATQGGRTAALDAIKQAGFDIEVSR